jgi:HEAT repeat protein
MDFSVTFARHFARLIWLIRSQPDSVTEQKGALRAVVTVAKEGSVVLRTDEGRLLANGTRLPEILTGITDITTALAGAVAYALTFDQGAAPADILAVARLIATESPDPLMSRVAQIAPRTVKMASVGDDDAHSRARATAQLTPELVAAIEADKALAEAAEAAAGAAAEVPLPEPVPEGVTGEATLDRLLSRLSRATDPKAATLLLEEMAGRIDVHAREGNVPLVLRSVTALIMRERTITDVDMRRAYLVKLRRIFRAQVLRVVMPAIDRDDELRDMLRTVLESAAEEGASIVFESIQRSRTLAERAMLVTLLQQLSAAMTVLLKLLTDRNWHVVRMAVELIGEMEAVEAERAVADVLRHPDDRVRRAATAVISRFDTEFAVDALYRALSDSSAQVRLQAVHGLEGRRNNPKAASVVVDAIDSEPEVEVQLAEIAALGRFATSDAVSKLARAAEPDGRLFRKKNAAYRVAAVQALAEARTGAAMSVLRNLTNDREKEVRDAAARGMTQSGRLSEAIAR